ncbi:LysE family translocator [Vibrio sp. ABG19]|uniref:LysE family translocator n=1 Tax=Vibrio sp. ABG19 TaxID=2817385 RepID=UPI00249DB723|nr:LysE family translocator [Vibrio sp. ABG19]WGY45652.1 LysE family translocator [Vibrio sp. ABG19]
MEWFSLAIFGLLIVISPGADFILVFKNSSRYGRKAGLLTALGIGLGVCIHVTYSVIGISHLVSQNEWLLNIVRYTGAAYLIYLGVSSLLSAKFSLPGGQEPGSQSRTGGCLLQGLLCNTLNPKTMLFFLSVFSQLISTAPDTPSMAVVYGAYLALLHIIWFGLMTYLITSARILVWLQHFGHRINQACGFGLITFGIVLSTSA